MAFQYSCSMPTIKETADQLNAVSDRLAAEVAKTNELLKSLNIGLSVWHAFQTLADGTQNEIGYAKYNGKWGILLQKTQQKTPTSVVTRLETWRFQEAPRWMRHAAIKHLPRLLEIIQKHAADFIVQAVDDANDVSKINWQLFNSLGDEHGKACGCALCETMYGPLPI